MLIAQKALDDFVSRRFESFLWMKKLTRKQLLAEFNSFRTRPQFKNEPWLHQLVCFYIGLCYPRFLFLLDMGLGKTALALWLINQRIRERKIDRALVTVPRLINVDSWCNDIEKHTDLEPWPVAVEYTEEKQDLLLEPRGEITIIDYHGLTLALTKKKKGGKKGRNQLMPDSKLLGYFRQAGYGFVAIDELHKLANPDSLWFALMDEITRQADYCYGMTGTLFGGPKDMLGIWPQFYLVDRGETFGENPALFKRTFFTAKTTAWKVEHEFNKRTLPTLSKMIRHRSVRYEDEEVLDLPKRHMVVHRLDMTREQREHYLRAVEGLLNAGGKLKELDGQWVRMRQICSGYLQWRDEYGEHNIRFKRNPKLEDLESLLEEMTDSKVVVSCEYTETGALISDHLTKLGIDHEWFYGGTKDKVASKRRFMEDKKCKVLLMNSSAGGTGTDGLQEVARYMVLFETPTSPKDRQQVLKRIHRGGQTKRTFYYDLTLDGSIEAGFLRSIEEGKDLHDSIINGRLPLSKKLLLGA